ncbi:NADH dehydrogenase [ubiquinone] iron-sulfur protein 4, mitochondrial [Culicoides brevitarsis]|uniref:NADH dehydrogenase [ubiquinone] iron-sulfur protein 4, mitochondrial n=1 Tax=Culicoides brevitarsis TaxID=469753 RepID=UPI00307BA603
MALVFRNLSRLGATQWLRSSFSTSSVVRKDPLSSKEAPIEENTVVTLKPEEIKQKQKLAGTITVPKKVDMSPIMGLPEEHVKTRRVRIYVPAKNSMQSGTDNLHHWEIEFDNRERWENPLMGWTSTGDPLSNMKVEFNSKEEAIEHCEKNGWRWFVDGEVKEKPHRVKNYGVNFAWNRRTRVSTK